MSLVGVPISFSGLLGLWPCGLPLELSSDDISAKLTEDPESIVAASTDFGMLTVKVPAAVLFPSSDRDIAELVRLAYESTQRITVAARGNGHSVWGQASAVGGVVVEMRSLGGDAAGDDQSSPRSTARLNVSEGGEPYVDAGGEQLWVDVLHEALRFGLAPRSWTDYLYLTVGGTLSNAGLGGQAFRHGPQISNVYELDVITGRGEMITCSKDSNSDLFYAVLGGLGQFGIITRARIGVEPAPDRVRWIRLIYTDFTAFTADQELLITLDEIRVPGKEVLKLERKKTKGLDYVEGFVVLGQTPVSNWRSSFFSDEDSKRIEALAALHGAAYCLEVAMNYRMDSAEDISQEIERLLEDLSFVPGFAFNNDVSYVEFLNRVHKGELQLRKLGFWAVPHPWLNLFVPRTRILDFDNGVFKGILQRNPSLGPILVYPLNRNKWDERMSAVIPDEDVFFTVGLLRSATREDWSQLEAQNEEILRFCELEGIEIKQYLPHHEGRSVWAKHFGRKWSTFLERKQKYDPKAILSPGQRIFDFPVA
ncbi:cytokinin dehydrogenase 6-like [Wolffia australiana]